ncbi:MAG: folylpolyglutamate synthase/dihydrofolate synthase family protein [Actinomycetota bacterium]|nr:folylpolyglutamate synthase/dihydrofolate synthase family protein [Actinomycetota bacterium]
MTDRESARDGRGRAVRTMDDAVAYLESHINRQPVGGKYEGLSLDSMQEIVGLLGDPHRVAPVVHITGTNGKGSTARMLTALLGAHGLSVGTYTSPHLETYNERIQWNGEPVSDERFASAIADVARIEPMLSTTPSHFEILTAAALAFFAEVAVDVIVAEVGVLGRYDATNVLDADVAVISNVGRDHTDFAGDWRRAIAYEKAGIIKPDSHVVLGETSPDLVEVFAAEPAASLWLRERDFRCTENRLAVGGRYVAVETPNGELRDLFLPLHGAHQGENAALAVAGAEAFFGRALDHSVAAPALGTVEVPGRFEVLARNPLVILDGAHNPDGAEAAGVVLEEEFTVDGRRIYVVGMLAGRDPLEMLEAIGAPRADLVIATTPPSPRALAAEELAGVARELGVRAEVVADVAEATEVARRQATEDDLVFVTGSLYVVGEARSALRSALGVS